MNRRPVHWQDRTLESLATYLNGFSFKPRHWGDEGLPIIRIRELLDESVEPDSYNGVEAEAFKINDGDLIFSWSATLAALIWNRGPALLNQHLFKVTPSQDVDIRFLNHLLNANLNALASRSHGTTMKHITRGDLASYSVLMPPLDEQRRIAEMLDSLDAEVRVTRKVVQKLKQAREGVLSRFIQAIPHNSFRPLSDLCSADICYGIVQSGPYVPDGIPVLAIRDLQGDFESSLHRTSPYIERRYRRSRVSAGDVLLSIKGTIGRVGVAPGHYQGNISREIARLRFTSAVDPSFACQYLLSQQAQRRLDLAVVGTTRAEVSIHVLKRFEFPAPDVEVQRRLVSGTRKVNQQINSEEKIIEKLQGLRQGLATDLLTGRVRMPVGAAS